MEEILIVSYQIGKGASRAALLDLCRLVWSLQTNTSHIISRVGKLSIITTTAAAAAMKRILPIKWASNIFPRSLKRHLLIQTTVVLVIIEPVNTACSPTLTTQMTSGDVRDLVASMHTQMEYPGVLCNQVHLIRITPGDSRVTVVCWAFENPPPTAFDKRVDFIGAVWIELITKGTQMGPPLLYRPEVTDADEACERTSENTISVTVKVQGEIGENAQPSASKSAAIATKDAVSPGNSSILVEPVGQTWTGQCPVCRRVFRHPSHFIRHQKSHTTRRDFKCRICESAYKDSFNLAKHMRTRHVGESVPLKRSSRAQMYASERAGHPCPECGKHFKSWRSLKKHRRTMHPEGMRHLCEECGVSFPRELHLKKHIRQVHERERKCICPHCGKSLTRSRNLPRHIRNVHEGDKADEKPVGQQHSF
ncbi:hypothetical protein CSKR_111738 [Clonorchis sinensis]|uniref:C2H2-type domain-containing protein n=1 Tax=Clonorchis sinensis TaxID=79923 RepID=A0A3R7CPD7_CLOSI|nr:hypothetical protein CSKR_111738 [Clonorchis sinensis]